MTAIIIAEYFVCHYISLPFNIEKKCTSKLNILFLKTKNFFIK